MSEYMLTVYRVELPRHQAILHVNDKGVICQARGYLYSAVGGNLQDLTTALKQLYGKRARIRKVA